ncbi:MAG: nicotinate (nicotinamide) nucleotide adenylyltransferase [Planctomycetota bacterium]
MRVGIFGGSFDPVHIGHLWIGEAATEELRLDRLLWVPTATQPLKPGGAVATDTQRLEMLRLAISGRDGHLVDDRELRRDGVSYSVETVAELRAESPGCEWFFILGSDSLASMPRWKQPETLLDEVTLSVVQRGGEPAIDFSILAGLCAVERLEHFRRHVLRMPTIEISSSEIRTRVGQGRAVRYRVPHAVESYLRTSGLYAQHTQ